MRNGLTTGFRKVLRKSEGNEKELRARADGRWVNRSRGLA